MESKRYSKEGGGTNSVKRRCALSSHCVICSDHHIVVCQSAVVGQRETRERRERERKMRRRRVREEDSPLRELCSLGTVINEDRESITMQSGVNLSGPLMDEGGRAHH